MKTFAALNSKIDFPTYKSKKVNKSIDEKRKLLVFAGNI